MVRGRTRGGWTAIAMASLVIAALATATAAPAGASALERRRTPRQGAACLPGHWKLDLDRLVSEASVTGTLTPSGSVDLVLHRGDFLQTYSDILTGETTGPSGTVKVEQKYAGAVSGSYRVSASHAASGAIDLTGLSNATEMVMTVTVKGISGAPNRQAPAPGTQTDAVTLVFTCRGDTLELGVGGAVSQHYDRLA